MKKLNIIIFTFLPLFCLSQQLFEKHYTFNTWARADQILEIPGEGYFAVGVNDSLAFDSAGQPTNEYRQGIIVKLNYNGDTLKTFQIGNGDTMYTYLYGGRNSDDFFRTAIVTDDGNIIVGGLTQSYNAQSLYDYDLWLLKFNTNLDTLWSKRFSIPDSALATSYSMGTKIHNSGIIIPGYENDFTTGNVQFQLSAFDSSGNLIFHQRILPQSYGELLGVAECSDHSFISVGFIFNGSAHGSDSSPLILKTDSIGNLEWYHVLPNNSGMNQATSITATQDGNYVYIWGNVIQNPNSYNVYIMHATKIDEQGNEIWTKDYGYTYDFYERVKELPNSELMISGWYTDTIINDEQALLMLCDSGGNLLWSRTFSDSSIVCMDGNFTSDGGFILTGETYCCNFTPGLGWTSSLWLLKADSLGLINSVINIPKPAINASLSLAYPNPSSGQTTVTVIIPPEDDNIKMGKKGAWLFLFDSQGRELKKIQLQTGLNTVSIDVTFLATGNYLFALSVDGFNEGVQKFIKQ